MYHAQSTQACKWCIEVQQRTPTLIFSSIEGSEINQISITEKLEKSKSKRKRQGKKKGQGKKKSGRRAVPQNVAIYNAPLLF
jgi:hypothetical protein